MWVTTYEFVCGQSIIRIRILLASSCVSSRLPPNKVPLLMLQIDTCELPHINLYVINQSYEFVFYSHPLVSPHVCLKIRRRRWCYELIHVSYHIWILMWSINHTNLYFISLPCFRPNKKVRTFGKWCWWRSPNKAPLLMLQIKTCELPHTNSYVVNQSYEFVFY